MKALNTSSTSPLQTSGNEEAQQTTRQPPKGAETTGSQSQGRWRCNGFRSIRAGLMAVAHDIYRSLGWVGVSAAETG
jgi:hypothetical protein